MNLTSPEYYINRELSWLEFNERVLEEAQDRGLPLLERLKFLAITSSNLDEFFMVRVAGLMDQVVAEFSGRDPSGLSASGALRLISKKVHAFVNKQYTCLTRSILPALERADVSFKNYTDLTDGEKETLERYFLNTIYPVLTPMAIDKNRPFPLLGSKTLNLIVRLAQKDAKKEAKKPAYAVVQLPSVLPRIITLEPKRRFIFLEDVLKEHIGRLFPGYRAEAVSVFRILRDSELNMGGDGAEDLLRAIEYSVKRRKWGEPVRLEIERDMPKNSRSFLQKILRLEDDDIYEIPEKLDLTVWFGFCNQKGFDELKSRPMLPAAVPAFLNRNPFDVIREKDVLVHHPYEDFGCVVDFVKAASEDPGVLAIKQTLYRVSGNSPIVAALISAVENGKQVTVLVELMARFDEENNINWAKRLEASGAHVVYGLSGLKTHCKLCLVVRKEDDGIRRYVHLGTGNYNDNTARIYTDMGLFTSKESFGQDISALFNVLTGYSTGTRFSKIFAAPDNLRDMFLRLINQEADNAAAGKPAAVTAKMNALVDTRIITALYAASRAGVRIRLIVRGICCLRPGVPELSENITVVSIVGQFLEHSRIFCFENAGEPRVFLSSADWMPRNLDQRVEIAFPVDSPELRERVMEVLEICLSDTEKLRLQQPDGSYSRVDRRGKEHVHSQELFHKMASGAASAGGNEGIVRRES